MFVEQKASILCPLCGIKFIPGEQNICPACTLRSIDNETVLSPNEEQLYCPYCQRYQRPPWINCERESTELLGAMLKKVRGLSKVQLKDAKFVWTEPHSKRIRIKIQFIRTVNETTKVLQSEVVEFIEKHSQCPDCKKSFTPHDWNALIQIRQHASHMRTLLSLEQNLVKQKWTEKAIRVETVEGGLDIFFKNEHDANGCLSYIKSHLPVTYKSSSQLISSNERDNTCNVKTTHALIIPKICKDDLILIMRPSFCKQLGNCSPLLLCLKVASQLYFLDPTNNRKLVITPSTFFALEPYSQIFSLKHIGKNFIVLDNEGKRSEESHNQLANWGLVVALADEMKQIFLKSHINAEVGQELIGYDLEEWAFIKNIPRYLLVKKIKTEEEIALRKGKKDQKRKESRVEKNKAKNEQENKNQQKSENVQEADKQEDLEWVDLSDEDEN